MLPPEKPVLGNEGHGVDLSRKIDQCLDEVMCCWTTGKPNLLDRKMA